MASQIQFDTDAAEIAALRGALQELVDCKALKERAEALHLGGMWSPFGAGWKVEYDRLRAEYLRRQPAAWERARAILGVAE